MKNKKILQKLSDRQFDAITADGNILLVAIPGSGKTRTLTNKILYEFDENDVRNIIAITYTNRGADEMQDRILKQLGFIPDNIWIGTIHKFCLDFIIRKYSRFSKVLSKPFSIIGEDDSRKIKDKLLDKYNLENDYYIDYTFDIFGQIKEIRYKDYVNEYYSELLKNRMIDFNYILYEAYKILNENELVTKQLSHIISLLCIDEYQDTQELQYQILSLIYKQRKDIKLFIVGDPNQAIYTSLGGVVKSGEELEILFSTKFIQKNLDCCYRSHQDIIDFYRNFCLEDFDMKSGTTKYNDPQVEIITDITKNDLISKIKNIILELKKVGIPDNEICILAPQWTFLYEFSNQLRKELPDLKFDAPNILPLKKDEESIIYKISKILLTKYSFANKSRVIFIVREVKKQLSDEFCIKLSYDNFELLKVILECRSNDSKATDYLRTSLTNFFTKIEALDIFNEKIHDFILNTELRIESYKRFGLEDDKLSLERTLRSREGIVISTAHSVKGEEYQAVIAFGVLEGYIPHWNSIYKNTAREDSKRLLFVISSRAKEKLFLIAEKGRTTKKGDEYLINKDLNELVENGY